MLVIRCILPLTLCLLSFASTGQNYTLRHYQVEDGLSNNSVTSCLQDKKGFLWIGTRDGLNRFDGYSFKVFRNTEGKSNSIGNNYIHCLYENSEGTLLIGTEQGLYEYLDKEEGFRLLPVTANMYIDLIAEDTLGNIWFISYFQLYRYEKKNQKLERYAPEEYFSPTCLTTTRDGRILIGTITGMLEKYHPETNSFSDFNAFAHSRPDANHWLRSLCRTRSGQIIAGTSDTEIKIIDPSVTSYTDFTVPGSKQPNLYIRSIIESGTGDLWLGTESGVYIYNLKTASVQHLEKNYNDPYSISDNAVYSMYQDREGGIWIGTSFGGINYAAHQTTPFTKYFPKKGENSINGNVVGEIQQDQYGHLWIGTQDAGLNKLDPATGRFTNFKPDNKPGSISYFVIHGLLVSGNELWIGTYEHGLDVLDIRTGKVIRHYQAWVSGFTHNFIYHIYQTRSGTILICTPHGIFAFDREKDRFERFNLLPPDVWYTSILEDETGIFWGATFGNGVYASATANRPALSFRHDEKDSSSLSSNRVNSVFEDSRNNIWFTTEEGLCRLNKMNNTFTRYGTKNGFPSDFILSILEDRVNNLWISTTKGIVRFQPDSGKIKIFNSTNGLISNQFNNNSAYKDANGRMYFGSDKGLVSFDPGEFRQNNYQSPVYITGLEVNGQPVEADSMGSPLKESIIYTDKITLAHNQSIFSIDFAALNYTRPEAMHYQYQMEGLSDRWITQVNNRRASFIELPAGTYTFRVRATNNDGVWSNEAKVSIVVLPPWWLSMPARIGYALITALIGFLIIFYYHNRMKEKARRNFEKLEIAKEKELLESKIEFFTNVAHEIKTPLTLIKVPLSKIIKKLGGHTEVENSLSIMNRNTARLIELTNQLLDFRKTEINRYQLSLEKTNISELIREVSTGFETLAEDRNIQLSLQIAPAPVYGLVDVDAFSKIIYNLFSNAVKYAATEVKISLVPETQDNPSFTIQVKNDGYLIPRDLSEKIFEPFYRISKTDTQTGTGIGLALALSLAELHGGTLSLGQPDNGMNVFSLTLPINGKATAENGRMTDFSQPAKENLES